MIGCSRGFHCCTHFGHSNLSNQFAKFFTGRFFRQMMETFSPSLRFTICCRAGARAACARGGSILCPLMTIPRRLGLLARGLDGRSFRDDFAVEDGSLVPPVPYERVLQLPFIWQDS